MRRGIERPCSSGVSREANIAATVAPRIATVVVLRPPPVEPGAAPMNIMRIVKASDAGQSERTGTAAKPAERVVIAWKSPATTVSRAPSPA